MRKPKQEKHAYDARIALWLKRDPIEERAGLNLYGMVNNNSNSWIDPLGLFLTSNTTPAGVEAVIILNGASATGAGAGVATAGVTAGTGTAAGTTAAGASTSVGTGVGVVISGGIATAISDDALTTRIANVISSAISRCRREKQCKLVDYYQSPNNPGGTAMYMCQYQCKGSTGVYSTWTVVPVSEGGYIANLFD